MYLSEGDGDVTDVDDLKESLKDGLIDARRKIAALRNEVKEKKRSLDKERELREHAEHELANLSMNGFREQPTPSPTFLRSRLQSATHRIKSPAPEHVEGLLEELKSARMLNKTLTEKLSHVEVELDEVLLSKEELRMELEASVTARGAALVDKIYTAQKERDTAVMTRLKLMNAEKEELIRRLKKLEKDHGFDSGVETGSLLGDDIPLNTDHLSLKEVVDRVTSSQQSRAIEFHGDVIVDRLSKVQNSNKRRSAEEYENIKEERDQARRDMEQLRDELNDINSEREMFETQHRKNEKNRLKAIQNQLKGVIQERDDAVQHVRHLEEELEKLKLQHSLKNSLSKEATLRKQFNTTLDEFESKLNEKESQITTAQHSYDELLAKLNSCIREKNAITKQLKDTIEEAREDKKRAEKLERLVEVLRKRKTISISDTID